MFKIILHRIISVVWLTNFLSEIRSLSPHDDETQLHVLSVILGSDLKSETIDDRLQGFQPLQWTWSSLSGLSKKLCEITCPRVKIEKLCQITLQRVMDWQLKNYVKSHVLMYVKTEKLCQITSLLFLHSTLVRKTSVKLNCWVITFRTEKFCQITLLWLYFHIKNRRKKNYVKSLHSYFFILFWFPKFLWNWIIALSDFLQNRKILSNHLTLTLKSHKNSKILSNHFTLISSFYSGSQNFCETELLH